MITTHLHKKNHLDVPKDVVESLFDLKFLEYRSFPAEQKSSFLPIKKEKDCELSSQQKKDYNRTF